MLKNAELPEGSPARKYKGRVVFQGNRVVNQNWETAIFQDLGSAPLLWKPAVLPIATVACQIMRSRSLTPSRHTFRLS